MEKESGKKNNNYNNYWHGNADATDTLKEEKREASAHAYTAPNHMNAAVLFFFCLLSSR